MVWLRRPLDLKMVRNWITRIRFWRGRVHYKFSAHLTSTVWVKIDIIDENDKKGELWWIFKFRIYSSLLSLLAHRFLTLLCFLCDVKYWQFTVINRVIKSGSGKRLLNFRSNFQNLTCNWHHRCSRTQARSRPAAPKKLPAPQLPSLSNFSLFFFFLLASANLRAAHSRIIFSVNKPQIQAHSVYCSSITCSLQ